MNANTDDSGMKPSAFGIPEPGYNTTKTRSLYKNTLSALNGGNQIRYICNIALYPYRWATL